MNTLIFRTIAPAVVGVMLIFSVFVLLRGHNEPGGGFIGGLIAASAIAILGMATDAERVRAAMKLHPIGFAGFGVFLAALSGLPSLAGQAPYLTGLWAELSVAGTAISLSTPLLFDIGVYFVVFGTVSAVALALESDREEE